MTVTIPDLAALKDKVVNLTVVSDEDGTAYPEPKKIEGTVLAASEAGVAFKPKGSSNVELLLVTQISEASAAPVAPKKVTQKKIDLVAEGQMRQHLADRHGISLKWCQENSEEAAVEFHNAQKHEDLGHDHEDKAAIKAAKEAADAAPDPAQPELPTGEQGDDAAAEAAAMNAQAVENAGSVTDDPNIPY